MIPFAQDTIIGVFEPSFAANCNIYKKKEGQKELKLRRIKKRHQNIINLCYFVARVNINPSSKGFRIEFFLRNKK
jgi:hypothetical protein